MSFRVAWIEVGTFVNRTRPAVGGLRAGHDGGPGDRSVFHMSLITAAIILDFAWSPVLSRRNDGAATEHTRLQSAFSEQRHSVNRWFLKLLGIKFLGLYALSATVATNIFFVRQVMQ